MNVIFKDNLLFFDDSCILCNKSIRFIHFIDKHKKISFASLQSPIGNDVQLKNKLKDPISTVIYHRKGIFHLQSSAIIYCLSDTRWFLKPILLLLLVPPILRNNLYNFIAKNRKRFFKNQTCSLPSESLRKQIVDN